MIWVTAEDNIIVEEISREALPDWSRNFCRGVGSVGLVVWVQSYLAYVLRCKDGLADE